MVDSSHIAPAIELIGATKRYHGAGSGIARKAETITALDAVDLTVAHGDIFGLVGESGSGKTTAGRLMVRLERPDEGLVRMDGRDINRLRRADLKRFRQRVQMIFQDPYQSLNPYLSVMETVVEPLAIRGGLTRTQRLDKVAETLTLAGLTPVEHYLHSYPHQLSGGQRQRLAIARAMVLDPQMVVADEPTSMLDATMAIQIYQLLLDIQKSRRVTLVFITHSLAAAYYLCNKIAVIYRGHVMETGPAATIIQYPRHPYTQALMDALPKYGHFWSGKRFNTLREEEREVDPQSGCPFYSRCNRAVPEQCARQKPGLKDTDQDGRAACFFV